MRLLEHIYYGYNQIRVLLNNCAKPWFKFGRKLGNYCGLYSCYTGVEEVIVDIPELVNWSLVST